jgi:hypothetical protein
MTVEQFVVLLVEHVERDDWDILELIPLPGYLRRYSRSDRSMIETLFGSKISFGDKRTELSDRIFKMIEVTI